MNKVFGIGLPKTGTSSLATYLTSRGINTLHFGSNDANEIREKIYRGIYKFDIMEKYDGLVNTGENYFEQLDKEYPGSKFILTTRSNKDRWLDSIEAHWDRMIKAVGVAKAMQVHHHLITFGCYLFNRDRFSYVYEYTHAMVHDYFRSRNDLLVLDIDNITDDDIDSLCEFVGIPYDGRPYPRMNVSR